MASAMGIGRFVYTPILPAMMEGAGLSAADAGLIASANYVGYLVGAIAAAGAWGQGRERTVVLWSLAANLALLAAMSVLSSLVGFMLVRFLAGIASALVMVFVSSIVFAAIAAAGRNDLQALHFAGVGVGIALSGLLVGVLQWLGGGWRADWLVSAAVTLAGLCAVPWLIGRPAAATVRPAPEPPFPRDVDLYKITLAYSLFGLGYIITATFLIAIVRESGAGGAAESFVWLLTGLAGAPSIWLWGKLSARIGAGRTYAIGSAVMATGVIASIGVEGYAGPAIGGMLLGGTFIAVTSLGLQIGRALAGEAPRRVLAVMTVGFSVGQIVGPFLAGHAADWTGSFVLPSLLGALVLLAGSALALSIAPDRAALR